MRISDWSSDVCSSDLRTWSVFGELQVKLAEDLQLDLANRYTDERKSATWIENSVAPYAPAEAAYGPAGALVTIRPLKFSNNSPQAILTWKPSRDFMLYGAYKTGYLSGGYNINTQATPRTNPDTLIFGPEKRSEEHTSELQSLMRISYAVFCLKKKKKPLKDK